MHDFEEIQADNHSQGRQYLVVQRRVQEAKTQTYFCSGPCVGQGFVWYSGIMAGGKGDAWEDFQDLCLGGGPCVPAAQSRRSWEPQYCIPDADKGINFAVQL